MGIEKEHTSYSQWKRINEYTFGLIKNVGLMDFEKTS